MPVAINILGNSVQMTVAFLFIGWVAELIIGSLYGKNYGFSAAKVMIYVVFHWILIYLMIWAMSWVSGGGETIGFNYVRAVSVAPLCFIILAKMFRESFWKLADFLAPLNAIGVGISRIGCVFAGCCHGYPSQWGIYSNEAQTICFPIQIIELVTLILIGVVLFVMAKRGMQQGKLYAWYMVMYGSTRFVFEFFRDNEKVLGNVSELAMHALLAFVLGVVALIMINNPRIQKEES